MNDLYVTKRNGRRELFDLSKMTKVLSWSAEGLDVSPSQVELNAKLHMYDGIPTSEIHEAITKAAADLISVENPDYQYMSARLALFGLRKEVYGRYDPPPFQEFVEDMVERGMYDADILKAYTWDELSIMDGLIDHDRDLNYSYAAMKQLLGKYLVQDRVTGRHYESPQMANMAIAACMFSKYKENRMEWVQRCYDALSTFQISFPTPIMSGMRTPTRQFSSCVLIECGDSLASINATSNAIVNYVSQRAGIGLSVASLRALGSPIRGGEAQHTGVIPFIKLFQAAVKSCSQGGVRGGAASVYFLGWHYEFEDLVVLKNNRGVETNRARQLDYGVLLNGFLWNRLLKGGSISLFSPSDVPGLEEAFYADQGEFARLYEIYESNPKIRRRTLPAIEYFSLLASERASTGRIYIANVDHMNTHSAFDPNQAPIKQSNLCLEIALPTSPVGDDGGEIALCTLAAFNLAHVNEHNVELIAELLVRSLDELLDYQNYPVPEARRAAMLRRTLGIGVINYAYWLADRGLAYSDGSANQPTHRLFESLQYHLLKASHKLAQEKGPCPAFHETSYAKGILPIDTYKKDVDTICPPTYFCDWEGLRKDILKDGLRNSTLMALMPSETSSQVSNATNGIEPPRGLMTVKNSKDGIFRQIVPEVTRLGKQYETAWMMKNMTGYIHLVAIMQKFVDQTISANTYYDPARYPEGKVPTAEVLKDLLTGYKFGVKTFYYHNTRDGSDDKAFKDLSHLLVPEDECGGACKI